MKKIVFLIVVLFFATSICSQGTVDVAASNEKISDQTEEKTNLQEEQESSDDLDVSDVKEQNEDYYSSLDNKKEEDNEEERKNYYGRVIFVDDNIVVIKKGRTEMTFFVPEIFKGMIQICQTIKVEYIIKDSKKIIKKIDIVKHSKCFKQ